MSTTIMPKLTCIVRLATGAELLHTYDLPPNIKKAESLVSNIIERIVDSIGGAKELPMAMFRDDAGNPTIVYNPDWVVSVEIQSVGADEYEKAIRRAQEKVQRRIRPVKK